MRLLHTKSLLFEEFFDSEIPAYAILSHRWEGKEVGFHEFEAAKERDGPEFSKIKNCCSFVRQQLYPIGVLDWVWIDTCCIDKKSSAELSEAINSMFRWYERASVCYAYLSSVDAGNWQAQGRQFRESPWFTRGWTLQELIAPERMYFLDRQWNIIRERYMLKTAISAITGIEEVYLRGRLDGIRIGRRPAEASIATRMSWASKRKTSRVEDIAYCLLGIFDINMPLLYGEGKKAFMRLQLEIIAKSDDESVFAWTNPDVKYGDQGMLASWPTWFADCGDIMIDVKSLRPPYSMTHKGLEFRIPAYPLGKYIKVALNCYRKFDGRAPRATIVLYCFGEKIGYRSSDNGTEFEDYTQNKKQDGNTDVIYIPQRGM